MARKSRFWADISPMLRAGPTACDARLALSMATRTSVSLPPANLITRASGSRLPKGVTPLKMKLARPSQKLRWLKIALIVVGVFRG